MAARIRLSRAQQALSVSPTMCPPRLRGVWQRLREPPVPSARRTSSSRCAVRPAQPSVCRTRRAGRSLPWPYRRGRAQVHPRVPIQLPQVEAVRGTQRTASLSERDCHPFVQQQSLSLTPKAMEVGLPERAHNARLTMCRRPTATSQRAPHPTRPRHVPRSTLHSSREAERF